MPIDKQTYIYELRHVSDYSTVKNYANLTSAQSFIYFVVARTAVLIVGARREEVIRAKYACVDKMLGYLMPGCICTMLRLIWGMISRYGEHCSPTFYRTSLIDPDLRALSVMDGLAWFYGLPQESTRRSHSISLLISRFSRHDPV